jgi:hypothetical protein
MRKADRLQRGNPKAHVAFWTWYGRLAAKGKVEAGNKEQAEGLMEAFHSGWDASVLEVSSRIAKEAAGL